MKTKAWMHLVRASISYTASRRRNSTSSSARLCRLPQARTTTSSTAWAMSWTKMN